MEMDMHSHYAYTTTAPLRGCHQLERIPALNFEALLRPTQRAVILATHPFDEVLACGGLLQLLSLRGHAMQLLSVTDEPFCAEHHEERRSVAQALENSDSLRRLGIPPVQMKWVRGRFLPGNLASQRDCLLAFLNRYVRSGDVVFAPWRRDGDADRETVARAAWLVCEALGARLVEMPIQAWQWVSWRDHQVPWHQTRKLALDRPTLARKRHAIKSQAVGPFALSASSEQRRHLQLHYELFIL